jgi:glycerol-1-phosphate dehydrogenase [NAD(P)+]
VNGGRLEEALRQASDTEHVLIGAGVLESADDLFERSFGDRAAMVVADETTLEVAGGAVQQRLEAAGRRLHEQFVFPGRPVLHADYENVETLVTALRHHAAIPIAVGAGTINDITKRAAFETDRPYMAVGTAASMDGYASFGAAITREGFKQTMECPAPRAFLADLSVMTGAPPKMIAAGYADLLAKLPAGADWIVADALEVEPIEPHAWSLVQGTLERATARPDALREDDGAAMEDLIEGLVMSGLAMQVTCSSRPASGAEHQFSHLWEMEGLGQEPREGEPPLSHGFKVGLGTVAIAALYEVAVELDLSRLDPDGRAEQWPPWEEVERQIRSTHEEHGLAERVVQESRAKYVTADRLATRLGLLGERWPELRRRLAEQLPPAAELRRRLRAAGCPTTPEELGLSRDRLRSSYRRAQMIRRRYTILDLLGEAGQLDACVGRLFEAGGFWASA